jgi:FkbM family methyltransferase
MIGKIVNGILSFTGFQIKHHETVEYLLSKGRYRWLQESDIKTVLDVGANSGQFAEFVHKILPQANIYSFEPLTNPFKKLEMLKKEIPFLHCYQFAIGSENGEMDMHLNEFSPSSSLLSMTELHSSTFPYTKNSVLQKVPVRTLDSLLSEFKLDKNILLKIDVQGFEMEVLKGSKELLDKISILIVETSFQELYKDQPLFHEVYKYLVDKNFIYHGNFDQMLSTINGEVLQSDAIFIKG